MINTNVINPHLLQQFTNDCRYPEKMYESRYQEWCNVSTTPVFLAISKSGSRVVTNILPLMRQIHIIPFTCFADRPEDSDYVQHAPFPMPLLYRKVNIALTMVREPYARHFSEYSFTHPKYCFHNIVSILLCFMNSFFTAGVSPEQTG